MRGINNRQKLNVRPAQRIDKNLLAAKQLKRRISRKKKEREAARRTA